MAGLGTLADAPMVARIVHAVTGADPDDLRIAGQGQTSVGWYVEAPAGPYCVLVEIPAEARHERHRDEPTNYAARHAIYEALTAAEAKSPRSIATARTIDGPDPTDGPLGLDGDRLGRRRAGDGHDPGQGRDRPRALPRGAACVARRGVRAPRKPRGRAPTGASPIDMRGCCPAGGRSCGRSTDGRCSHIRSFAPRTSS